MEQLNLEFNICIIEVSEGEQRGKVDEKYFNNNGWKFSKFGENYKPTDSRNSVNPKHKKHEGNYMKAHFNQNAEREKS